MPKLPEPEHQAQQREHAEPTESLRPMPLVVVLVTLAVVIFGAGYIMFSEPFGDPLLGDQRTLADLRPPVAGAAGTADGKQIFNAQCAACHQATGLGLPGVFPPLDGSHFVNNKPIVIANILLHGITGEIKVGDTTYKGTMPSFAHLSDAEIAAVASYVRSAWSNKSEPLGADLVAQERGAKRRSAPFENGEQIEALAAQ